MHGNKNIFLWSYVLGQCPASHPWAFDDGKMCCKNNMEKQNANNPQCKDGQLISRSSKCCKDAQYVECPSFPKNKIKCEDFRIEPQKDGKSRQYHYNCTVKPV